MNLINFIEYLYQTEQNKRNFGILINNRLYTKNRFQNPKLLQGHHIIPTGFEAIPFSTIKWTIRFLKKEKVQQKGFRLTENTITLNKDKLLYLTKEMHTRLHDYLDEAKKNLFHNISMKKNMIFSTVFLNLSFRMREERFQGFYANRIGWGSNKRNKSLFKIINSYDKGTMKAERVFPGLVHANFG